MIKKSKILFYLSLLGIFLYSSGSVRAGLTLKKKENSEQFLIEKKEPLIMPPDFDELPLPGNAGLKNQEMIGEDDDSLSLKTLIKNSKKSSKKTSSSNNLSSEIEKKINKKLNKK